MDREIILEKLEALRRCIRRVESKRPKTAELLVSDWDLQDIITLNLSRATTLRRYCRSYYLLVGTGTARLHGRSVRSTGRSRYTNRRSCRQDEKSRWFSKRGDPELRSDRLADRVFDLLEKSSDFTEYAIAILNALGPENESM